MTDRQPRWGVSRRTLATVALVAALVLAGCGNGATGTDSPGVDVSADTVRGDVLSAVGETDSYVITGSTNVTILANNQQQQSRVETETRVDRANREFVSDQTSEVLGQTTQVNAYLKDGVLYQRSQAFVQAYSSEWIRQDLADNVSATFRTVDLLSQVEVALPNSSLSVEGTATVEGTETYVLAADVQAEAIEEYALGSLQSSGLAASVNVTDASITVYASTETGRPLRVESATNATISLQGQRLEVRSSADARVSYEPVSVSLPEGASTAVNASTALGS